MSVLGRIGFVKFLELMFVSNTCVPAGHRAVVTMNLLMSMSHQSSGPSLRMPVEAQGMATLGSYLTLI